MLLISLPHEIDEKYVKRIADLVHPMEVLVERDILNERVPIDQIEILITYGKQVNADTLDLMTSLKWIQVFQSGVELIPMKELQKRGILLTNIQDFHSIPLSEYVLSMLLYFTRAIPKYKKSQTVREWNRRELDGEIYGKTVAIFGAGKIGQVIAERCKFLGMNVIGVNTSGKRKHHFDDMYTMDQKLEVLKKSDFVVLLLPATEETYRCFGKKEFQAMKDSAYLINVGRGTLIHTEELIESLRAGDIKGAAIDVTDPEPLPADHPLWEVENLILTPHVAAVTERFFDRAIDKVALNWEAYKRNERPPYYIDLARGY
ncbi:D-2-hydroxyacid dehydrogenase [Bacillus thermotolerans]|uniref:D-2-hydroxyacid dehydrogenase n=1 Tax=Bacillus thermotolerans TaxID=1221996 RepID=UPI00057DDAF9|nr:D-2-hydroxyacid dehydrogenase [Bacillus thermotolerans]KKB34015.1 D-3-phosphoglycerate dehydrogenase [Bacillus thermotolerans]